MQRGGVGRAAFEFEQIFGDGPALILFAQTAGDRDTDIVKKDLIDLVVSRQSDDRLDGDSGRGHFQKHEGDAVLGFAVEIGAAEGEHAIGEMSVRGPDL